MSMPEMVFTARVSHSVVMPAWFISQFDLTTPNSKLVPHPRAKLQRRP